MFSVKIRTTPVIKEEIDAYMLSGKGNPGEIIGYLRSIIRQYVVAKKGIGCIDVDLDTAWSNLQKVLVDNPEKKEHKK